MTLADIATFILLPLFAYVAIFWIALEIWLEARPDHSDVRAVRSRVSIHQFLVAGLLHRGRE